MPGYGYSPPVLTRELKEPKQSVLRTRKKDTGPSAPYDVDQFHSLVDTAPPINPNSVHKTQAIPIRNIDPSMPSSYNNPLNAFMDQLILDKAAPTTVLFSLVIDNAIISRDGDYHFSISRLSHCQIKSARHQTSRWSETKSSTSVPKPPLQRTIT
jgi:hypothetical protein